MIKNYLYIARCLDNSLYIGVCNNIEQRIKRHNAGLGSAWIKQHGLAKVVYLEEYQNYSEAHKRELQIKKWSRIKKEHLIKGLKP
jgi:putative endonuclease